MKNYHVVVCGASLGGIQAAISACKDGKKVLLTEESVWIGGQLTTQAVPPDEHRWIEKTGCTQTYRKFRQDVRNYYRNLDNIADEIKTKECFCPGNSWVSRLAHEPKVALEILNSYIKPFIDDGLLTVAYQTVPISATLEHDEIKTLTIKNLVTKQQEQVAADYFLDATDCGDLLPVVGAEYRTGAESKADFLEPHAPQIADKDDMQPITWVCAVELLGDEDEGVYKIAKPEMYDYFAGLNVPYDDNKLFSWYLPDAVLQKKKKWAFYDDEIREGSKGLFSYRRIIAKDNYKGNINEVSLINWPQNDFHLCNIYDTENADYNKYMARQLTLSFVYYMQNEMQRADGSKGYKVRLRGDVTGTADGLALMPYIRESRRIVGEYTVKEQDVAKTDRDTTDFATFDDSIGVGSYCIDLHVTTKTGTFLYEPARPFEIPLGSLIPKRINNLIAACKNISCTHLTNGCYRLHPVEWNIGEAAGHLAAFCINNNMSPRQVRQEKLRDFQDTLLQNGVMLHWDKAEMWDL